MKTSQHSPLPLARQPEPAAARAHAAPGAATAAAIDASPRLIAQRRRWESIFGTPGEPPVQRKRTTQPADTELIDKFGTAGHNLPTAVLSGKTTAPEKGAAIWAFLGTAYTASKDNGTRYWDQLQADIVKLQSPTDKPGLERDNQAKRTGYDNKFFDNYATVKKHLVDPDAADGGSVYRVNSEGYDPASSSEPVVKTDANEGDYSNEFDVATGKFKAKWNFAAHVDRNGGPIRYDDKALKAGKGVNNSEIVWQQAKAAAKRHFLLSRTKDADVAAAMKGFSEIRRDTVINDETKEVVYMALSDGENWVNATHTWTVGDEEFKAVLGTPNGRSSVYMLKDHLDELQKTIDTVTAAKNGLDIKFKPL